MLKRFATKEWIAANWFVALAPALLLVSYLFTRSVDWRSSGHDAEAVTIFDWCITVPLLYFFCYRKTLSTQQMLLRLLAIACVGVWIAGKMVPLEFQQILPELKWARWAGLAVLSLIELRLVVAVMRLSFSGTAEAKDLESRGAPPIVAKLMLMEARFWRAVWRLIRGR